MDTYVLRTNSGQSYLHDTYGTEEVLEEYILSNCFMNVYDHDGKRYSLRTSDIFMYELHSTNVVQTLGELTAKDSATVEYFLEIDAEGFTDYLNANEYFIAKHTDEQSNAPFTENQLYSVIDEALRMNSTIKKIQSKGAK